MKTKSTIVAGLASLAFAIPAAHAAIIDFDGPGVCNAAADGNGALMACANWAYLSQSYGDMPGMIDVQYSAPRIPGTSLNWWDADYNTLRGVAFANGSDGNSQGRIDIKSLNGMAVMLTHFDMGAYANTSRDTHITISDLSGNVLYAFKGSVGMSSPNMPTSFNGMWIGADGIRIEWEDSAYNVGIDNVAYGMTHAVPEPATYAMLGAGLAVLGLLARRRKV
ncbi:VPLPA-CTERM protein sorting domain-containing protein [Duganella sp. CF402]|uniref:PEP-CTERM sorting domain-containing protein n=1 Tax=unclassified Duganella TaxID=2636909 RepID=UPI0008C8CB25|nr:MULTISPECIES: PEP-CTERM sorting domain-containing protein [unclassified Duganella]RZT09559.1 putative secreted protein [Duganella sp. BK701]SEL52329.1 VPLPA-CTERM protein sorting domain-containing protein [Duganella sp. CF402]